MHEAVRIGFAHPWCAPISFETSNGTFKLLADGVGFEEVPETAAKPCLLEEGGAKSGASSSCDKLRRIVEAWPRLDEDGKSCVSKIVESLLAQ